MTRLRLGMLTPSSNTVLEPAMARMLAGLSDVSVHFSRFRVTHIDLDDAGLAQFDNARLVGAAELLADARVDAIVWNGTSAGWMGFQSDERLRTRIVAKTGIPATTSVLALNAVLSERGVRRFGLVTPYRDDVQVHIVRGYERAGFECVAERHLGLRDNYSFAEVEPAQIERMVHEVAAEDVEAVITFCTNLRAFELVPGLEQALGIPVYDTVALAAWGALRLVGVDPAEVKGWGRLFTD